MQNFGLVDIDDDDDAIELFYWHSLTLKWHSSRHSSVDQCAPTILRPRVQIPTTPAMLLSIYISIVWFEKYENRQKEAGIGPYLKMTFKHIMFKQLAN